MVSFKFKRINVVTYIEHYIFLKVKLRFRHMSFNLFTSTFIYSLHFSVHGNI